MRVTDYIAQFIQNTLKVKTVFMVSGGGMMFLSDGLACRRSLHVVCNHHEQASAMAAVGYAKQTNGFGVAMVTTGCGGTNAMTGLLNAWQDSAKVFFVSGQCKLKQTVRGTQLPLRQFGVQEADIIALVTPLTKYAVMIEDANDIAYELEKASWLAQTGRPGPVWIDVPMDIQGREIDTEKLRHFTPPVEQPPTAQVADLKELACELARAKRPVILAGQGVALSETQSQLKKLAKLVKAPVVTSFLGGNSIAGCDPCYLGRIGTKGARAANLAVANADLLVVLGCRLSVSSTGHEYSLFARQAKIVVVDIDAVEHTKNTVRIDKLILSDLRTFFTRFVPMLKPSKGGAWLARCQDIKSRYPIVTGHPLGEGTGVSLYDFIDAVNENLRGQPRWSVVSDAGSSFYVTTQAIEVAANQRYITSGGQAEMGFSLPAAIGVAAAKSKKVIAISGDGSVQMNIQELQTLKHYQLPVKLCVWNNEGYLSIRATQRKFFNGRLIGTDKDSGVSFPSLKKLAVAYGLRYVCIPNKAALKTRLPEALAGDDPVICEILCMKDETIVPSISSVKLPTGQMKSMPPEDMFPFLPWEEFKSLMVIEPIART
ncbi:MAG: thiamine pyrophosphate-binding protein [Kiritimatiellae bacterium]|nr:thiamine pyrophosphate-binding protein [Kiritimatiellia bacterium]